jgi:hypothetical protein
MKPGSIGPGTLQIAAISNPYSPEVVGAVDTPDLAEDVALIGNLACIADFRSGLQLVDVTDPASPSLLGHFDTPGYAVSVKSLGAYAYVADSQSGVEIVDISDPSSPTLEGSLDTPGSAKDLFLDYPHVYIADDSYGFEIMDVSHPATPIFTFFLDTPGTALGLTAVGNFAYLADGEAGLEIIDLSSSPFDAGIVGNEPMTYAVDVAVSGNYAYVIDASFGLRIVDVSDPASPEIVGSLKTPGIPLAVSVMNNIACVTNGESGLLIVDVSNPTAPMYKGILDTPGSASGLVQQTEFLYLADESSGLQIAPGVCDILTPVNLTSFQAIPQNQSILVRWVFSSESAVSAIELHRSQQNEGPYTLVFMATSTDRDEFEFVDSDVKPGGPYFYRLVITDRLGETRSFGPISASMHSPSYRTELGMGRPNPFSSSNGSMSIEFQLKQHGLASVRVFDVSGRLVRVLVNSVLDPGPHEVSWDGLDSSGNGTETGMYFIRLEAGNMTDAQSVLRLSTFTRPNRAR